MQFHSLSLSLSEHKYENEKVSNGSLANRMEANQRKTAQNVHTITRRKRRRTKTTHKQTENISTPIDL